MESLKPRSRGQANLTVFVRDCATLGPVPGCPLMFFVAPTAGAESKGTAPSEFAREATNQHGYTTIRVPGNQRLIVAVADQARRHATRSVYVPAIAPGQANAIEICRAPVERRVFWGRVCARDGQPIPDATITPFLVKDGVESPLEVHSTDGNGEFRVDLQAADDLWCRAEARPYTPAIVALSRMAISDVRPIEIVLKLGAALRVGLLGTQDLDSLEVRVTPLCGAVVALADNSSSAPWIAAPRWAKRVVADGWTQFDGLPSDVGLSVAVYAGGELIYVCPSLVFLDTGLRSIEIVLDASQTIQGTVVDSHGAPIEGVLVGMRRSWGAGAAPFVGAFGVERSMRSDASGRFCFERVRQGYFTLGVGAELGEPSIESCVWAEPVEIYVSRESQRAVTLNTAQRRRITGRVLSPDGIPIAGARVCATGRMGARSRVVSSDNGEFVIPCVLGPDCQVEAWPPLTPALEGLAVSSPVVVRDGGDLGDLRLRITGSLTLRLLSQEGHVTVDLVSDAPTTWSRDFFVLGGWLAIRDIAPGEYAVVVRGEQDTIGYAERVVVEEGRTTIATIAGGGDGRILLAVSGEEHYVQFSLKRDGGGIVDRFANYQDLDILRRVPAGPWTIIAKSDRTGAVVEKPIEIREGLLHEVRFDF